MSCHFVMRSERGQTGGKSYSRQRLRINKKHRIHHHQGQTPNRTGFSWRTIHPNVSSPSVLPLHYLTASTHRDHKQKGSSASARPDPITKPTSKQENIVELSGRSMRSLKNSTRIHSKTKRRQKFLDGVSRPDPESNGDLARKRYRLSYLSRMRCRSATWPVLGKEMGGQTETKWLRYGKRGD